ncbi:hypothetical protein GWK47_045880 [Chionoecetes opilio]|uniref:Uncharacterized protein n=1 Tax=Chionoecetes opilio TaxID=41210 RepID=A0A8J5CHB4_CHIOP|nr:hypothetical protein GWK47_045880 [Chionoecetes opilio]
MGNPFPGPCPRQRLETVKNSNLRTGEPGEYPGARDHRPGLQRFRACLTGRPIDGHTTHPAHTLHALNTSTGGLHHPQEQGDQEMGDIVKPDVSRGNAKMLMRRQKIRLRRPDVGLLPTPPPPPARPGGKHLNIQPQMGEGQEQGQEGHFPKATGDLDQAFSVQHRPPTPPAERVSTAGTSSAPKRSSLTARNFEKWAAKGNSRVF